MAPFFIGKCKPPYIIVLSDVIRGKSAFYSGTIAGKMEFPIKRQTIGEIK